jgi:membrane dipeptidase
MPDPTFDFYPRGTELVVTDRIEQRMHAELESGADASAAYDAMEDEQVRQLREEPAFRDRLRERYREAGFEEIVVEFVDFPDTTGPELFAEEVAPQFD